MPRDNVKGLPPGVIVWPRTTDIYGIRYRTGDGQQLREKVGPDRQAAIKLLAIRKGELAARKYARPTRYTLRVACDEYLATIEGVLKDYPNQKRYADLWCEALGRKLLSDIRPVDVEKWMRARLTAPRRDDEPGSLPWSAASVNRARAFLHRLFNIGMRNGWCDRNPVTLTRKHNENNERDRWLGSRGADESARLRAASSDFLWRCIVIAICTSLRLSEQLQLRWSDVDPPNRLIRVPHPKGDRNKRWVPISDACLDALQGLPSRMRSEWVFPGRLGRPLSRWGLRKQFDAALTTAKIHDLVWHDLRHTTASLLSQLGENAQIVQAVMGHSSPAMTARYSHLAGQDLLRAVNRLGALLPLDGEGGREDVTQGIACPVPQNVPQ